MTNVGIKLGRSGNKKVGKKDARQIGQKYYWPDRACASGHHDWRIVSNSSCVGCIRSSKLKRVNEKDPGQVKNAEPRRSAEN